MFFGVAIPAIIVGVIAWFYLADSPAKAKWLTLEEKTWLTGALEKEKQETAASNKHVSVRTVFGNGRVWMLSAIYFGFIYGLYALGFFLPTIIAGFEGIYGTKFDVFQKGLITAIPYLPAAFALYFWSKDATRRGVKTWHIALPALIGGLSIPLALFAGSPAATIAVITITAMSIFAALPNFWTVPTQFLTGAAAAAGIALINTVGNLAGFSAGYVTGWLKDLTGGYTVPMFVVGGFMLLSSILMVTLSRSGKVSEGVPAEALDPAGAGHHSEP
jgi:nitrate/nitrite transporter NarK